MSDDYDAMSVEEAQRKAIQLNALLEQRRGWTPSRVTEWWNTPNPGLNG